MRILTRYVLRELAGPTIIAFALYTFVLLMNFFVIMSEYAFRFHIPLGDLGTLFLLQLPHVVVLTLPMGFLVGALIATGRLSTDNELLAARACGLVPRVVLWPVLATGVVLFGLNAVLLCEVTPRGNHAITRQYFEIFHRNILRSFDARVFEGRVLPGLTVYIGEKVIDDGEETWSRVLLSKSDPETHQPQVLFADAARPLRDDETGALGLWLPRLEVHDLRPSGAEYELRRLQDNQLRLPLPNMLQKRRDKHVRESTLGELLTRLEETLGKNPVAHRMTLMEVHKRFAIPFASIVFAFLGVGLGQQVRRGGTAQGYVVGFAIFVAYYLLFYAGERLAIEGRVVPWLSMWFGNVVFGTVALLIYLHRSTDGKLLYRVLHWGPMRRLRNAIYRSLVGARQLGTRLRTRPSAHALPAAPFGFPRIIDRYIGTEYLRLLSMVVFSGVGVFVLVTLFQLLDDILRTGVGTLVVIRLYLAWLPEILGYVLPISCLVATLLCLGILTRHNEITAFKVHGISLYRTFAPLGVIAVVVTGFSFYLYDTLLPRSAERYQEAYNEVRGTSTPPLAVRWMGSAEDGIFYYFDGFDRATGTFENLNIFELDPVEWTVRRRLWAPRTLWGEDGQLYFKHGWERTFRHGQMRFRRFKLEKFPFDEPRDSFEWQWSAVPKHMTYNELRSFVDYREDSGLPSTALRIELHNKRAFPFLSLIMVLIGYPFAFKLGRKGSLYGIGLAILLGGTYWTAAMLAVFLGKVGVLPPLMAAWAPNAAFALAGMYLLLDLDT